MKLLLHIVITLLLTILTQVGGVIYLLSLIIVNTNTRKRRAKRIGFFAILYLIVTFLIVPFIAPKFGRERVKNSELIQAHSFYIILLNRNYVKPQLNQTLFKIARDLREKHKGVKLIYLDANFPFFNKFPLLPHLSHNDGKKIDLAFIYQTKDGVLTNKKKSISGYGIFVKYLNHNDNTTKICKKKGFWQYDFTKYFSFGAVNNDLILSTEATKNLMNSILKQTQIKKIFIEPHLKKRMNLTNSKIRFQGCHAVRHDDHIHIQL